MKIEVDVKVNRRVPGAPVRATFGHLKSMII